MISSTIRVLLLATLAAVYGAAQSFAHEGHEGPEPTQTVAIPRITSVGSDIELVAIPDGHKPNGLISRAPTRCFSQSPRRKLPTC